MKRYNKRITKALIRLCWCAGWPVFLLLANFQRHVSRAKAQIWNTLFHKEFYWFVSWFWLTQKQYCFCLIYQLSYWPKLTLSILPIILLGFVGFGQPLFWQSASKSKGWPILLTSALANISPGMKLNTLLVSIYRVAQYSPFSSGSGS